eukprot:5421882-Amphidinium_carterae.2
MGKELPVSISVAGCCVSSNFQQDGSVRREVSTIWSAISQRQQHDTESDDSLTLTWHASHPSLHMPDCVQQVAPPSSLGAAKLKWER